MREHKESLFFAKKENQANSTIQPRRGRQRPKYYPTKTWESLFFCLINFSRAVTQELQTKFGHGKNLAQPTEAFRFRGEPDHPHCVYQSREASPDRYCLSLWHYWRSRLLIASRFRINRPSNSQNGIRTAEGSGEKKREETSHKRTNILSHGCLFTDMEISSP